MGQQNGAQRLRHAILVGLPAGPGEVGKGDHRLDSQRRLIDPGSVGSRNSLGGSSGPTQPGQKAEGHY